MAEQVTPTADEFAELLYEYWENGYACGGARQREMIAADLGAKMRGRADALMRAGEKQEGKLLAMFRAALEAK